MEIPIDRLYNPQEIIEQIEQIPTCSTKRIYLNFLFEGDNTLQTLHAELAETLDNEAYEYINTYFKLPDSINLDLENQIEILDKMLINLCIEVDDNFKNFQVAVFNFFEAKANENVKAEVIKMSQDSGYAPDKLPVNRYYTLTPDVALGNVTRLIDIKEQIKTQFKSFKKPADEEFNRSLIYTFQPWQLNDGEQPPNINDLNLKEEVVVLRNLREYVNVMLVDAWDDLLVVQESLGETSFEQQIEGKIRNSGLSLQMIKAKSQTYFGIRETNEKIANPLRIGDEYNERRRQLTSKKSYFRSVHFGTRRVDGLMLSIPVPEDVEKVLEDKEIIQVEGIDQEALESVKAYLVQNPNYILEEARHGFSSIATESMKDIGIFEEDTGRLAELLNAKKTKTKAQNPKKFGVITSHEFKGMSIATDYGLFQIPSTKSAKLITALATIAHELAHIVQHYAKKQSAIVGLRETDPEKPTLSTLGRSSILAESGAIKIEEIVKEIFGSKRSSSLRQWELVQQLINGKNYWEIMRFAIGKKNMDDEQAKIKADNNFRAIERLYQDFGAPGFSNHNDKLVYPTSFGLLRYTLQGHPQYRNLPFYISGVPSHRVEEFDLQFNKKGNQILSEVQIINAVLRAAVTYLNQNNEG